ALLLPQLLTRSRNPPAVLGSVRSRALSRAVVLHRFPQQSFVDRAKHFVGQFQRANRLAVQIMNIDGCHFVSHVAPVPCPRSTILFSPPSLPPSTDRR